MKSLYGMPRSQALPFLVFEAAILVASLSSPVPLRGQSCFRGRPLPICRTFVIGELGYGYQVGGRDVAALGVGMEIGAMANVTPGSAVGGTAYLAAQFFELPRFGAKARYRRWLSRNISLEAAPGVVLYHEGWTLGFAGNVALDVADRFAITSSFESFGEQRLWSVGARTGSDWGLAECDESPRGVVPGSCQMGPGPMALVLALAVAFICALASGGGPYYVG